MEHSGVSSHGPQFPECPRVLRRNKIYPPFPDNNKTSHNDPDDESTDTLCLLGAGDCAMGFTYILTHPLPLLLFPLGPPKAPEDRCQSLRTYSGHWRLCGERRPIMESKPVDYVFLPLNPCFLLDFENCLKKTILLNCSLFILNLKVILTLEWHF